MQAQPQGRAPVAYLGPPGTFTSQAVERLRLVGADPAVPLAAVADVVEAVERGEHAFGLVPVENSVEGVVTSTLDRLVFATTRARIAEEVVVPVTFDAFCAPAYAGHPGPWTVVSHPHALAQCSWYVRRHASGTRQAASTAEACALAARAAAAVGVRDADPVLALAAPPAGPRYGLVRRDERVEDHRDAATRFFLLAGAVAPPTHPCRTMLVVTPPDDRTGVLRALLDPFADRGIALSALSVRPLRSALGAYCFILTVAGHMGDAALASAVEGVLDGGNSVKLLGSYWQSPQPVTTLFRLDSPPGSVARASSAGARAALFSPPRLG